MEERRRSIENDKIELKFLHTISRLGLDGAGIGLLVRISMLEVTMNLDLWDKKWDD